MLLRTQQHKRAAFTLMEIIVVVAIILILAGAGALVLPRFLADANVSRAKTDVLALEKAIGAYQAKYGVYPQNLEILAESDGTNPAYIKESLLKDPWQQPYIYEPGNLHPKTKIPHIYSAGAPGTGQIIANWD
jgi:general secretion pathway protein G